MGHNKATIDFATQKIGSKTTRVFDFSKAICLYDDERKRLLGDVLYNAEINYMKKMDGTIVMVDLGDYTCSSLEIENTSFGSIYHKFTVPFHCTISLEQWLKSHHREGAL